MAEHSQKSKTLLRKELTTQANSLLKPVKNKKELVIKFNSITKQKQVSLTRVIVKAVLDGKIQDVGQGVAYINSLGTNPTLIIKDKQRRPRTKQPKRIYFEIEGEENVVIPTNPVISVEDRRKKVELGVAIERVRLAKIEEEKKQKIIKKRQVAYEAEQLRLNKIKKAEDDINFKAKLSEKFLKQKVKIREININEQRLNLIRKRDDLKQKKKNKLITTETYKKYQAKNALEKIRIDQLEKKHNFSETKRVLKEIAKIEADRVQELKNVRFKLRQQQEKEAFQEKYGVFTKQILYLDDGEDNFYEIDDDVELRDSAKHFKIWRIILTEPASNLKVLYRHMMEKLDELGGSNIVIALEDTSSGKIRHTTINGNYLFSFEDFEDRINDIVSGNVAGSDVLDSNGNWILRQDNYDIQVMRLAGYGAPEYNMIYKSSKNTDDTMVDCGFRAVCCCLGKGDFKIGLETMKKLYKLDYNDIEKFNTLDKINYFIKENELPIFVKGNGVVLNQDNGVVNLRTIISRNPTETKINNKKIMLGKMGQNDLAIPKTLTSKSRTKADLDSYLLKLNEEYDWVDVENNPKFEYIIYDTKQEHFEYALGGRLEINDNIYVGFNGSLYKCEGVKNIYRRFMSCEVNNFNVREVEKMTLHYVGFDFETIIDFKARNRMKPYSCSWGMLNENQLKLLDDADKKGDVEFVKKFKKEHMYTAIGFDCVKKFMKWISDNEADKKFVLIGFNNANFDNFILVDEIMKASNDDIQINDIMYNGSQLLNATINGRHSFFDLSRHLTGKLVDCCNGFKINICGKTTLDHHQYQAKYDAGELIDYITDNEELIDYNERDVLSVLIIYSRYKNAISNVEGMEGLSNNLHNNLTIGSLAYKRFNNHWKQNHIKLPLLNEQQYKDILKFKCAGRVEMFNGTQFIEEAVSSYDVCSLYPYVMGILNCYYPTGNIHDTEVFVEDKIGFYYCDIDQAVLKEKNLPNIYPMKTETENVWDYDGVLYDYYISSEMIKLLRKYGCGVVVKKGMYFDEKIKSCKMFKPILEMMKIKVEQDILNKNGDPEYNAVLRETIKLLMNAPSGKVIEGLHIDKIEYCENIEKLARIQVKYGEVEIISVIGNGIMIGYKREEIEVLEKEQRPVYLGVLIYDYAKTYMYENSYAIIGKDKLLYTDTDATKLRVADSKEWLDYATKTNVPCWDEVLEYNPEYANHKIFNPDGKVFGSFEDELAKMNKVEGNPVFSCIEKKSWCYAKGDNTKFRFKGLNENNIVLTGCEAFLKLGKKNEVVLNQDKQVEINNFYNNATNKLRDNVVGFYKKIYDGHEMLVLCRQFKKNVKNAKKNVTLYETDRQNEMFNSISVVYSIKHIKLKPVTEN